MLAFPAAIRIYVAIQPVDMRKSFNGLWSAVGEQLGEDPKGGAVFCFINQEGTRLKLLYWDGTGVCSQTPTVRCRPNKAASPGRGPC